LFIDGEFDNAMDIYWKLAPLSEGGGGLEAGYFHSGIVMAQTNKYAHWCNAGNGGSIRQPTGRLYDYRKERMRAGLRAIGLTPREPEEEFYVGRVKHVKGARLRTYVKNASYTQ
jgi:hypothetical protein